MDIKRLRLQDDMGGQLGMQRRQHLVAKARANVAHALVRVVGGIVAGQQEGPVDAGALAAAKVGA